MFTNLASRDRIMLLVTAGMLILEFVGMYFLSITGKSAQVRRFLAMGGRALARRISERVINGKVFVTYSYHYHNQEYSVEISPVRKKESIEVYFDPNHPEKSVTMADVPKWRRLLPMMLPAVIVVVIALVYKILYQ